MILLCKIMFLVGVVYFIIQLTRETISNIRQNNDSLRK